MKEIVYQNVTEGKLTKHLKAAELVALSEVSLAKLWMARPWPFYKTHRTKKIAGLAISWKRSEFKVVASGFRRFHGSGQHEGWDHIATPSRGVLWVVGYWKNDPEKRLYGYWLTWFLNSWMPMNGDQWTSMRQNIVITRTIPVVEDLISELKMRRYKVGGKLKYLEGTLGGGDTNSIKWAGTLAGLRRFVNEGLDRLWTTGNINVEYVGETPKTGAGGQMQHHGMKVVQKVRGPHTA